MNAKTNTATRTPGPWTVEDDHPQHACLHICGPKDEWGYTREIATIYMLDDADANAAFIVTACNAHDALVAENAKLHHERAEDVDRMERAAICIEHQTKELIVLITALLKIIDDPKMDSDTQRLIRAHAIARAALAKVTP